MADINKLRRYYITSLSHKTAEIITIGIAAVPMSAGEWTKFAEVERLIDNLKQQRDKLKRKINKKKRRVHRLNKKRNRA